MSEIRVEIEERIKAIDENLLSLKRALGYDLGAVRNVLGGPVSLARWLKLKVDILYQVLQEMEDEE